MTSPRSQWRTSPRSEGSSFSSPLHRTVPRLALRPAPGGIQPGEAARVNPGRLAAAYRRDSIVRAVPLLLFARPRVIRFAGAVGVELRITRADPGFLRIHLRRLPIPQI